MSVAHLNTDPGSARAVRHPSRGLVSVSTESLPGLARLTVSTVAHTAGWGMVAYARTWTRVARAMVDPREMASLSEDLGAVAGQVTVVARAIAQGTPVSEALERWAMPALERTRDVLQARAALVQVASEPELLRGAGEELLRRSRDVWSPQGRHPAYAGILRDLAPDEARILVYLLKDGPQPTVDVVRGGVIGRFSTERELARGLSMLGLRSSVRFAEAVPQYLNNLTRLGLIWTSPEPVSDLLRYQVLEAQPDVLAALHAARRATTVRRSIHLTPFGQDFARACFADAEEIADLPAHEAPPEAVTTEE